MWEEFCNVVIVSGNHSLENLMKAMIKANRLVHQLAIVTVQHKAFTGEERAHVVVLDSESVAEYMNLLKKIKKMDHVPCVIACIGAEEDKLLGLLSGQNIDQVLTRPWRMDAVFFCFKNILRLWASQRQEKLYRLYLDTLINSVPDLIWFKDLSGAHLKVNDEFCYTTGKTHEEVYGRDELFIWSLKEYVCLESDAQVVNLRRTGIFDEKVTGKRGTRQYKVYKSPLIDERGEVVGTVGTGRDITELKNRDTKLEIILNNIPFAVLVRDDQGLVSNVNQKFEAYFQVKGAEMIGKPYRLEEQFPNLSVLRKAASNEKEIQIAGVSGTRYITIHQEDLYDFFQIKVGEITVYRDITKEKNYERRIKNIANTDHLSGLFNRRAIYEYAQDMECLQPAALMYIDLDNFKKLNDAYGHQSGDETLVAVSELLRRSFPNAFIARMGGDEFVVLRTGDFSDCAVAEQAAELVWKFRRSFEQDTKTQMLSASIGVAIAREFSGDIDVLLKAADEALYRVKKSGKNCCEICRV